MLKINLIAIGDIKEKYLKDATNEYLKRLTRFAEVKIIELKENNPKSNYPAEIKSALQKDKTEIEKHIKGYCLCLDIEGKMLTSEEFSKSIEKISINNSEISFIIGASNGLDEELKSRCNLRLSFSKMTFPHQLMRVIFLEQLYRAFTISNNISYHK